MKIVFGLFVALIALALAPARAAEGSGAAQPVDSAVKIRSAANLEVPRRRATRTVATTNGHTHHRKITTVSSRFHPAATGAAVTRIAYRPAAATTCGGSACGTPIVLFIGITY